MSDQINQGFGRFTKHIILGSIFGGVLSSIPLLNILNCCFCLLNIAGIVFALSMYLNANPNDTLNNGEAAGFGAAAGAGAGLIAGLMGLVVNILLGGILAPILDKVPGASRQMFAASAAWGVLVIPINIVLFAAFGALGAFLGMQAFFKTRIRRS